MKNTCYVRKTMQETTSAYIYSEKQLKDIKILLTITFKNIISKQILLSLIELHLCNSAKWKMIFYDTAPGQM